ncbi:uncharacterized [Tachysurus ichikawai]
MKTSLTPRSLEDVLSKRKALRNSLCGFKSTSLSHSSVLFKLNTSGPNPVYAYIIVYRQIRLATKGGCRENVNSVGLGRHKFHNQVLKWE